MGQVLTTEHHHDMDTTQDVDHVQLVGVYKVHCVVCRGIYAYIQ